MKNKQAFQNVFRNTGLVVLVTHLLLAVAIFSEWFGPAQGVGGNFCEAAREGLIKQPANSFSNLAFAAFGLLAAWQVSQFKFHSNRNAITTHSFFANFLCILMVLLSPGSFAMHATETYLGGYFDMLSMYLIASIMMSYALERMFKLKVVSFIAFFLMVLAVCHYFHFQLRHIAFPIVVFSGNFIFALFVITASVLEFINVFLHKPTIEKKWALFAAMTAVLSFSIWLTGRNDHPWCHPYSYLQAHALWHILDALALYFVFRFYVSENDERYEASS
jgi:hypothetical protein